MKYLYTLVLITFLASCANPEINNQSEIENNEQVSEVTNQEIDNEIEKSFSGETEKSEENKIKKLNASYKNPKTEVDMVINYSTDENENIEYIEAVATTFDISGFNEKIQYLVGKPIKEAEDIYISGSSLSSEAFNNAIKNNM